MQAVEKINGCVSLYCHASSLKLTAAYKYLLVCVLNFNQATKHSFYKDYSVFYFYGEYYVLCLISGPEY